MAGTEKNAMMSLYRGVEGNTIQGFAGKIFIGHLK
jgi:hypothetical protein